MLTQAERIRALVGNLKNWSWDVAQQFKIEKEDAEALIEFYKEQQKECITRAEFFDYAEEHGFVAWSKECSDNAMKSLEWIDKLTAENERLNAKLEKIELTIQSFRDESEDMEDAFYEICKEIEE